MSLITLLFIRNKRQTQQQSSFVAIIVVEKHLSNDNYSNFFHLSPHLSLKEH